MIDSHDKSVKTELDARLPSPSNEEADTIAQHRALNGEMRYRNRRICGTFEKRRVIEPITDNDCGMCVGSRCPSSRSSCNKLGVIAAGLGDLPLRAPTRCPTASKPEANNSGTHRKTSSMALATSFAWISCSKNSILTLDDEMRPG